MNRPRKSLETAFADSWRTSLATMLTPVAIVLTAWELLHRQSLLMFALNPDVATTIPAERAQLWRWAQSALGVGAVGAAVWFYRALTWRSVWPAAWFLPVIACVGLPFLGLSTFEFEHPYLAGLCVVTLGAAIAAAVRTLAPRLSLFDGDLSERAAFWLVAGGCLFFTAWLGFLAHWRFVTFHSMPYDMSWETNAVDGIITSGIPRTSVGADYYYPTAKLPHNYADLHTPFAFYLYAPFYALFRDGRTLLWLQTLHFAVGGIGAYWIGRRWMLKRWIGVVFAFLYLSNPNIHGHCLHDLHANYLAIPSMILALGAMEARRVKLALFSAVVTALCREETGLYAACIGVFWAVSSRERVRVRAGFATAIMGLLVLVVITKWLMPAAGGQPRWSHFSLFFDATAPGMGGVAKSFLLNPMAVVTAITNPLRVEVVFLSLVWAGFVGVFGARAWPFLLLHLGLIVASTNGAFFIIGINYSAPVVPPALMLSFAGIRRLVHDRVLPRAQLRARRLTVLAFVITTAIAGSHLYGNIFSKTYKFEFGMAPQRRHTQANYQNYLSYIRRLPPFGARERALWEVIGKVPKGVPITTSWYLNPQLSNRPVSLLYPDLGTKHPRENHAKYVVLDRLPPMMAPSSEQAEMEMRRRAGWRVFFENDHGIIFERTTQ